VLAWVALAAVLLVPVWWGADASFPWDLDNLAPGSVLKGLAAHFGHGWYSSYGPLPYYLMGAVYLPVLAAMKLLHELGRPSGAWPYGFAHPGFSILVLVVAARLTTVASALGIAWLAARRAGEEDANAPRWLVPLLLLGSSQFAYYGRTSNADVHALFWLFLAVTLAETAGESLARLGFAAAAAVAALGCKEQSAPAVAVLGIACAWKAWRLPGVPVQRWRAVFLTGFAAVVTYAVLWQLPFNLAGWRAHNEFLWKEALYPRTFPATVLGFLGLFGRAGSYLPFALGLPVLAGLALALARRVSLRGLGLRGWMVLAHLAGFVARIGYVYPRFLLPLLVLALPMAARGMSVPPRARAALAALLVVAGLTGGPLVSWLQLADPRLPAERWLGANVAAGSTVEVAGNAHGNVRVPHGYTLVRIDEDELLAKPRSPVGDVVVISSADSFYLVRRADVRARWWDVVHAADGPYRSVATFERPFGVALLDATWLAPRIEIFRRVPGSGVPAMLDSSAMRDSSAVRDSSATGGAGTVRGAAANP
jgi:hypothetical protein